MTFDLGFGRSRRNPAFSGGTTGAPLLAPISTGTRPINQFAGLNDAFSGVLSDGGSFPATDYASLGTFGLRGAGGADATGLGLGQGQAPINLMPELSGWQKAGIGMQGLSSLTNAYMGMQQYGLAKDQFDFQRGAYEANYENQVRDTNRQLEERQRRRLRERPDSAIPLEEYMARFGAR